MNSSDKINWGEYTDIIDQIIDRTEISNSIEKDISTQSSSLDWGEYSDIINSNLNSLDINISSDLSTDNNPLTIEELNSLEFWAKLYTDLKIDQSYIESTNSNVCKKEPVDKIINVNIDGKIVKTSSNALEKQALALQQVVSESHKIYPRKMLQIIKSNKNIENYMGICRAIIKLSKMYRI